MRQYLWNSRINLTKQTFKFTKKRLRLWSKMVTFYMHRMKYICVVNTPKIYMTPSSCYYTYFEQGLLSFCICIAACQTWTFCCIERYKFPKNANWFQIHIDILRLFFYKRNAVKKHWSFFPPSGNLTIFFTIFQFMDHYGTPSNSQSIYWQVQTQKDSSLLCDFLGSRIP